MAKNDIDKPPRRQCIFCGGYGLTKEHIWPDWLKNYVPRDGSYTIHSGSVSFSTSPLFRSFFQHKETTRRPGDPHAQRLNIVCKECNSGWMSRLQQKAKPILVPLIKGEWGHLTSLEANTLSAWATMYTMVVELKHPATAATTRETRNTFRNSQLPPVNWYVWIGRYQGSLWKGVFNHFGLSPKGIPIQLDELKSDRSITGLYNSQSTAFVIRELFFLTYTSQSILEIFDPKQFADSNGLSLIWPNNDTVINKPDRILDDNEADAISRLFLPESERPRVRPAWVP